MSGGKDSEPTDPDPLTCTQGRRMWGGGPQKLPFRTKVLQDTTEGILNIIIRDGGKGYLEGVRAFSYGPD